MLSIFFMIFKKAQCPELNASYGGVAGDFRFLFCGALNSGYWRFESISIMAQKPCSVLYLRMELLFDIIRMFFFQLFGESSADGYSYWSSERKLAGIDLRVVQARGLQCFMLVSELHSLYR